MIIFKCKWRQKLDSIKKSLAPQLVISNVLYAMNTQSEFDFNTIWNETQSLEYVSMSVFQVYRKILPYRIPLDTAWKEAILGLFMLQICFVFILIIDKYRLSSIVEIR